MTDWTAEARKIAADVHKNHFHSRRGSGLYADDGDQTIGFYVYDNNPWSDGKTGGDRDRMYEALATVMANRGCREVGRAHYPSTGEDAGYTFAAIYVSAEPVNADDDMAAAKAAILMALQARDARYSDRKT
jgi:hypothetical protein